MNEDIELARQYALHQSEPAFETLVSRYLGLVHSAALRQVRDPQLAEEITQTVFVILARKAGSLSTKTILPGWLYKTTRYVASTALKMQYRRERREQEAQMQTTTQEPQADSIWQQLAPFLDEAMAQLRENDRDALVLRFFQNKSLCEVGMAFGMNEYAAQKRVARGLEKLRVIFEKRGISTSTGAISGTIAANSTQTAPALLAKSVTAAAITKGTVSSASTLTLMKGALKIMAWSKTKTTIIAGVVVLLAAGTGVIAVKEIEKQRHKSHPQQQLTRLSPVTFGIIKISPNSSMSVVSASQLKTMIQSNNSNRSYGRQVSSFGFKMGSSRDAIMQQLEQVHATILTNSPELLCAEPEKTPTMKKNPPEMDFSFTNEKLTRVTLVVSRATNSPASVVQIQ